MTQPQHRLFSDRLFQWLLTFHGNHWRFGPWYERRKVSWRFRVDEPQPPRTNACVDLLYGKDGTMIDNLAEVRKCTRPYTPVYIVQRWHGTIIENIVTEARKAREREKTNPQVIAHHERQSLDAHATMANIWRTCPAIICHRWNAETWTRQGNLSSTPACDSFHHQAVQPQLS
jgi:hypothetical protein